jgi:hypothetical protein
VFLNQFMYVCILILISSVNSTELSSYSCGVLEWRQVVEKYVLRLGLQCSDVLDRPKW